MRAKGKQQDTMPEDSPDEPDNSPSLGRPSKKNHIPQLGGDNAILHLVECLGSEDRSVRWDAAIKLGEIGDARAIDTLMSMMGTYADYRLVKALANIGMPALPHLASLVGNADWHGSYHAALGLVGLGGKGIAEAVTLSLSDNPQIQWLAILALEQVEYPHNTPTAAFIEALYLVHLYITDFAARMLGKRNDPAVIPQLRSLMNEESIHIRIRCKAAASLAFMGLTDGIELLIPGIGGSLQGPSTHACAIESLGEKAFPFLMAELEKEGWREHRHMPILNFFAYVKHPAVVPAVALGLKSEQPIVRSNAAYILGEQTDPREIAALITALEDEDANVQRDVIRALLKIGTPEAVSEVERWQNSQQA